MGVRPGYKQTDVGVIPNEWEVTPMSELLTEFRGGAPLKPSDFTRTGVKILPKGGVGRTGWLSIEEDNLQYCAQSYAATHRNNQVDWSFTIVVLRDLVPSGPSIGLMVQIRESETYVLAQGVYGFKLNEKADSRYLIQQSNTRWYRQIMNSIMVGSTQVHITNTAFRRARVPLPPPAEQRAIADALGDVDALLGALDRLIAKKRDLKQAAMQQLLTGQTRLPGFHGEWEVKRFGEVAFPRRDRVDPGSAGVQDFCIELEHIASASGELLGSTSTGGQSSLKSVFRTGDVLFGKLRAYLRKYWLATRSGVCSTEVWVFAPKDRLVTTAFLFQLIKTDEFIEAASNSYGTHMPRSDWNIVKNYEFKLPPLPEQAVISEVLAEIDAELSALDQRRSKTRALKQAMMQELLTGRTRLV